MEGEKGENTYSVIRYGFHAYLVGGKGKRE